MSLRNSLIGFLAIDAAAAFSGHLFPVLLAIACGCVCIVIDWLYPEPV